jgi:hypothetical protein
MSGLLFGIPFASTVTTAAPLVMQISNPGGSGRTVYISRVIGSTGTAAAPTGSPATLMSLLLATGPVILDFDGRIIVPPGNSLTITLTIGSGSTAATGSISWWEK